MRFRRYMEATSTSLHLRKTSGIGGSRGPPGYQRSLLLLARCLLYLRENIQNYLGFLKSFPLVCIDGRKEQGPCSGGL